MGKGCANALAGQGDRCAAAVPALTGCACCRVGPPWSLPLLRPGIARISTGYLAGRNIKLWIAPLTVNANS
jgi:hypothetical protein